MTTTSDIRDTASAVENISEGIEAAAARAEAASQSMREKMQSVRETATHRVHQFQDVAMDTVTKRPGWTIAAAVLVGTTIGFFAGRRGHHHH